MSILAFLVARHCALYWLIVFHYSFFCLHSWLINWLIVMHLIKSKCISIVLYVIEACPGNRYLEKSLQISVARILMKIFKSKSNEIVMECQNYFGFYTIATLIRSRKVRFLYKLVNSQKELHVRTVQCRCAWRSQHHFLFLVCYCFYTWFLAIAIASFSAYTLLRGVFLFCFMFLCLYCATCRGE